MKALVVTFVLSVMFVSHARAEDDALTAAMGQYTQITGAWISPAAQRALRIQVADALGVPASTHGSNSPTISADIFGRGFIRVPPPIVLAPAPPSAPAPLGPSNNFASQLPFILFNFIQRYATIKLRVQPVPPRDYTVSINGELCPTTEQAVYVVPPGSSEVNVIRGQAPACVWQGQLASGQTVEIPCNF